MSNRTGCGARLRCPRQSTRSVPVRQRSFRSPFGSQLRWLLCLAAMVITAPLIATAQTGYIPYYGKNQIRYDRFDWQIYETDHFEIYYYPEIQPHLERMAGYAESAYQHISSELKYDLAHKVPLILFQTSSECSVKVGRSKVKVDKYVGS